MTDTITKHFVTFLSPGSFVAENTTKAIDSWDVPAAQAMAETLRLAGWPDTRPVWTGSCPATSGPISPASSASAALAPKEPTAQGGKS